jgi:hypothetical protein
VALSVVAIVILIVLDGRPDVRGGSKKKSESETLEIFFSSFYSHVAQVRKREEAWRYIGSADVTNSHMLVICALVLTKATLVPTQHPHYNFVGNFGLAVVCLSNLFVL